ncbi:MAG: hypothetical protein IPJ06_02570 [Saprospiraceae bacterium]|nr:hypothetical protein [Saprospiraceae bacterium]
MFQTLCGNDAVEVTRTVIVHNYPLLETSINGVIVTTNNDGADDVAPPMEVCNETGNIYFDYFIDLNNVPGDVRAFQTRTLTNVSTSMCDNCAAVLTAFSPYSGTASLIDPTMDGTIVMRFRAWLDLNSNNSIDPGECAGDWAEYTFTLKADVILTCANDTTVAACQDQATVDQAFADWLTTTTFTGGKNPVLTDNNTGAPDACGGNTMVTWTVTSDCEPDVTCTATGTVTEDDEDPVLTCPADLTAQCNISEQPPYADLAAFETAGGTSSDNCEVDPNTFTLFSEVSDNNSCPELVTRTYTVEDLCGNTASCVQLITVDDTIEPTLDSTPGDLTVECDAIPVADVITGSDNCDQMVAVTFQEVQNNGLCADSYTLVRTWTAEDDCGNTVSHVQTITVEDTTMPTWDQGMPADETVECDAIPVVFGPVTASDNCDLAVDVTFGESQTPGNCPDYYTLTRTWTATDDCGNSTVHTQTITVEDTTAPTLLAGCPTDEIIECSDPVPAAAVVTAEDNCDPAPIVSMAEVTDLSGCGGYTGTITRTWTAEDACGNSAEICTQVITIEDSTMPTFSTPSDITIQKDVNCAYDADPSLTGDVMDEMDNCSVGLDATYMDDVTIGACEGQEVITRTWSLEDNCGNVTTDIQVITAVDEILPEFPLLDDVTIYTFDDGASCPSPADIGLVVDNMNPISSGNAPFQFTIHGVTVDGPTVYSDNCSSPPNLDIYVVSINPDFNSDADDCQRVIRVAYRVFDDCGNFVTRQQFFTVLDNTPPTFTVPADVTIYTDNNCTMMPDPVFTGDCNGRSG